jgi:hypothetical protein
MSALRSRLVAVSAVAIGLAIAGVGVAVAMNSSRGIRRDEDLGRASVAGTSPCPRQEPHGLRSSRSGADVTLVPSGTDQVLLCRYDGPFGGPDARVVPRFRLVAERLMVSRDRAGPLAEDLDRLQRSPGGAAGECGKQGAAIIAFFHYPSGTDDPVSVNPTACMTATNGQLTSEAGAGDGSILDKLEALIHAKAARSSGSRTATIAGYLWLCGGGAPGRCFASTIGGCAPPDGCSRSDRVVAVDTAGQMVAEQRLRYPYPDGRFRLQVRPGQYAVELLADGPRIHDRVIQTQGATARARHTTKIVFTFDIP